MGILEKNYIVEMPNGERWSVPVSVIAENRAKEYAGEFDGDVKKSLAEDTAPLFEGEPYEVEDWAKNNMRWSDVAGCAQLLTPKPNDYEDGWCNAVVEIL